MLPDYLLNWILEDRLGIYEDLLVIRASSWSAWLPGDSYDADNASHQRYVQIMDDGITAEIFKKGRTKYDGDDQDSHATEIEEY